MEAQRNKRRRAVRLTPEGVETLATAVTRRWTETDGDGKFTREKRAALLGVSGPTADRILKGQPVDRSSLFVVFGALDLPWKESYCVPDGDAESVPEPGPEPAEAQRPPSRRWGRGAAIAAGVIVLVALTVAYRPFAEWVGHMRTVNRQLSGITVFANELESATAAYHRGDYASARRHCRAVLLAARQLQSASRLAVAMRLSADLDVVAGNYEQARTAYVEVVRLRKLLRDDAALPPVYESLGGVEAKLGDLAAAGRALTLARDGFAAAGDENGVASAERGLGSVRYRAGDLMGADALFEASLTRARSLGKAELETDVRARRALVARDQGDLDGARRALEGCLKFWTERQHPRWIALTRMQLGSVETLAGNGALARKLLESSRAGYLALGDRDGADQCAEWLDRLDSGRPARSNRRSTRASMYAGWTLAQTVRRPARTTSSSGAARWTSWRR